MTIHKYYALLVGVLVASSGCVIAMEHLNPEKIPGQNNNNERDLCYLCTDELDENAVSISETCEHRLHKACYATIMADARYNKNCFICSRPIVKPKQDTSKVKPLLVPVEKDVLLKERERNLKRLIIMARNEEIVRIEGSRELMSLRARDAISQEDYATILTSAAKKDALGLEAVLQKLRRRK